MFTRPKLSSANAAVVKQEHAASLHTTSDFADMSFLDKAMLEECEVSFSEDGKFDEKKFNLEMVELEDLTNHDREHVAHLLQNHIDYAKSGKAERILSEWPESSKKFIKVMPTDYKKALEMMAKSDTEKV